MKTIQIIQISLEELQNEIKRGVEAGLGDKLIDPLNTKKTKEYLTRNDVSKMLQIDISTVHNWSKKGILSAYQIGGRIYYRSSDIENAIIKLKR
jgi:hypothetical protein